jgi:PKD repeat protein
MGSAPRVAHGATLNHTFSTPQRVALAVEVRDRTGSTAQAAVWVTVLDTTAPVVGAPPDLAAAAGAAVAFSASTVSDNDPAFASAGRIEWSFLDAGQPVVLTGTNASHTFAAPGDYVVTLTATDGAANTQSATFTVHVTASSSFGLREAAIVALALAAAGVAGLAVLRSQRARREAEEARARAAEEERAAKAAREKSKAKAGGKKRLK